MPIVVIALDYFQMFAGAITLRGQDVLEIGGAIAPSSIAGYHVNSWTAVDISQNRFEIGLGSDAIPAWYKPHLMDAAALGFDDCSFDVIYSTDCFEHVGDFSAVIQECFRVLRPGGVLFSKFAPIWSGPKGHHAWVEVDGSVHTFNDGIVPDWQHLIGDDKAFWSSVCARTDAAVADAVTEYSLRSGDLNRHTDDEFLRQIESMPWRKVLNIPLRSSAGALNGVRQELSRSYPDVRDFRTDGFLWILAKPPFPLGRALKAWTVLPLAVARHYGAGRILRQLGIAGK